jgi:GT2 family glycosyltransferase
MTVVIPCLNEEENIRPAYEETVAELSRYSALEILFVDDGSTDGTLDVIRDLAESDARVSYLSFSRNFGLEAAFSAGYRYAKHDWILHLDADLQFPPGQAHALVAAADKGYDAVFGIRQNRRDPYVRRLSSRVHDLLARRLFGIELPAGATTFRLVRSEVARRVVALGMGTPYFLATVPRLTRAWTTVPTAHRARARGSSKVRVRGLARHAVELFVSYSDRPVAAAVGGCVLGAVVALAGAVAIGTGNPAIGGALLAVSVAIGLAGLAVVARYLVHIARGQPRPPLYLIRRANVPVAPDDLLYPSTAGQVTTP